MAIAAAVQTRTGLVCQRLPSGSGARCHPGRAGTANGTTASDTSETSGAADARGAIPPGGEAALPAAGSAMTYAPTADRCRGCLGAVGVDSHRLAGADDSSALAPPLRV
jgi:hypothetical protein